MTVRRAGARLLAALVLAAVLGAAGCAYLPRAPEPSTRVGEWAAERDLATRQTKLYDGLDHRATASATHLSLAVREARARRLGEWLSWTPKELEDRLARERKEAAEGEAFVIALYTPQTRENDLDGLSSVWRVAVKVDGADVLARKITGLPRDVTNLGLYPYAGPFDVLYLASFPPAPGGALAGRPFVLELASARGKVVLDYGRSEGEPLPQEPAPPP